MNSGTKNIRIPRKRSFHPTTWNFHHLKLCNSSKKTEVIVTILRLTLNCYSRTEIYSDDHHISNIIIYYIWFLQVRKEKISGYFGTTVLVLVAWSHQWISWSSRFGSLFELTLLWRMCSAVIMVDVEEEVEDGLKKYWAIGSGTIGNWKLGNLLHNLRNYITFLIPFPIF